MSIRKNLLIWLLTGFVFAGLVTGIATYYKTHQEVGKVLDYELREIANSMRYSSSFIPDQLEKMGDEKPDYNDFVVQIWNEHGKLIYSSLPSAKLPQASRLGFSTITRLTGDWRAYTLFTGDRVIQAAQTEGDRWEIAAGIAMRMLAPLAVLVPVLVFLGWIAVRKSLAPLARVTAEVEQRDASAMAPLDTGAVPEEIRPLLRALNRLLGRLDQSIASQRRFVADAAHELRTPLTALSLQAQLVEQAQDAGERNESARNLRLGIARASHLVNQLLTLARQEPGAQHPFTRVDLALLALQVVGELAPLADLKNIDLGVSVNQPQWVNGDEDGLRILVGNLIDNAIRYTPEGGKVDVNLARDGNLLVLEVKDNGPGIPPGEREKIFERFYRIAGNEVQGSGLGLAIVRQIIDRHGAVIDIAAGENSMGAVFSIKFPPFSPG
jgi:two-component system OmpR family sensor kinase